MGGVEREYVESSPGWESYALGTMLLAAAILSAPAFAIATVLLWTNAPTGGWLRLLSRLAMFWASAVWWLGVMAVVAAMVISAHPVLIALLMPLGGAMALLGVVCVQTSKELMAAHQP